jgi:dipeptidyl aminopeptidase/acylaminoacyl peptidase
MHYLFEDRETDDVPGGNERTRIPTPEDILIGEDARKNKAVADAASPAEYAKSLKDASLPPHLLIHGDSDNRVSPKQSERVFQTYQNLGVESELVIVEGGAHGGRQFEDMTPKSIEFFKTHFE